MWKVKRMGQTNSTRCQKERWNFGTKSGFRERGRESNQRWPPHFKSGRLDGVVIETRKFMSGSFLGRVCSIVFCDELKTISNFRAYNWKASWHRDKGFCEMLYSNENLNGLPCSIVDCSIRAEEVPLSLLVPRQITAKVGNVLLIAPRIT